MKYNDSFNDLSKLDKLDRMFIEQFKTKNGGVKEPTESMMLPTDSLAELENALKKNTTYCFKVTPGKTGWCATCRTGAKKGESGFCKLGEKNWKPKNPAEVAVATTSSVKYFIEILTRVVFQLSTSSMRL